MADQDHGLQEQAQAVGISGRFFTGSSYQS